MISNTIFNMQQETLVAVHVYKRNNGMRTKASS